MDDLEIRKVAIKNALDHEGKANESAVFSKIVGMDKSVLKDVKALKDRIHSTIIDVNKLSIEEQRVEALRTGINTERNKPAERTGLKDLPGVNGKVVLRFPPEPGGFMHLGNAIAAMINYLYKERYGGKLWLRFEDTNPNKVGEKFIKSFRDGLAWLGIKYDEEKFISSDMDKIYSAGEKLLESEKAYVCMCTPEEVKSFRFKGEECEHRIHTIEENRHLWNFAMDGKIEPGKAFVRFKGNMKDKDLALRDPTIFRIIKTDYKPYLLWPTYDLASIIEEDICGVTHILRSNEFKVSLQNKLREALGIKSPVIVQFSRYNFKGTPFAKRMLRDLIEKGFVGGWDDIRLPTISAIKRRGIMPEAIKEFTLSVGYSESKHEYGWDLLLTLNRRIIDSSSKRYFFVSSPTKLHIEGAGSKTVKIPMHPSVDIGFRQIETNGEFMIDGNDARSLSNGSLLRLKDLYTVKVEKIGKDGIFAKFVSDKILGEEKIVQWVTEDSVPIRITIVDRLLNDDGSFNADSLKTLDGLAEASSESIKEGETVQFERFGFCILDNRDSNSFIYISR